MAKFWSRVDDVRISCWKVSFYLGSRRRPGSAKILNAYLGSNFQAFLLETLNTGDEKAKYPLKLYFNRSWDFGIWAAGAVGRNQFSVYDPHCSSCTCCQFWLEDGRCVLCAIGGKPALKDFEVWKRWKLWKCPTKLATSRPLIALNEEKNAQANEVNCKNVS